MLHDVSAGCLTDDQGQLNPVNQKGVGKMCQTAAHSVCGENLYCVEFRAVEVKALKHALSDTMNHL